MLKNYKFDLIISKFLTKNKLKNILIKKKINVIYNFAAKFNGKKKLLYKTNYLLTINILDAIIQCNKKIKLINANSSSIFGNSKNIDINKFSPSTYYALTKLYSFLYSRFYRIFYKLPVYNMILFNHTSEYQKNFFFIKKIICHLLKFKRNRIKKTLLIGNLNSLRDWSYAKDIVKTCIKISNNEEPNDYFINSQNKISNRKILKIILKKINIKYYIIKKNKKINYYSDNGRVILSSIEKFYRDNDYEILSKSNSSSFKNNPHHRHFMVPSKIIDCILKNYRLS